MTQIRMKDLVRIHRSITKMTPGEVFEGNILKETERIGDYMNEVSEKTAEIILDNTSEEELVAAVNAMIATLVTGMFIQEGSVASLRFLMSDDMQPFAHTLVLSVIGMLIEEEIL